MIALACKCGFVPRQDGEGLRAAAFGPFVVELNALGGAGATLLEVDLADSVLGVGMWHQQMQVKVGWLLAPREDHAGLPRPQ